MNMFKLETGRLRRWQWRFIARCSDIPHPFSDWKPLQRQVLGKFEDKITEIEDRSQPDQMGMRYCRGILQKVRHNQLYLQASSFS
jgi:hypothetical protein